VKWRAMLPWVAAGGVVLALAADVVMWKFDPARIHRLLGAIAHPADFAAGGLTPMPPGAAMRGLAIMRWLGTGVFALAALPTIFIVARRGKKLAPPDAAVAAGCALTALALTGPWFGGDKIMRFSLIAIIPAALAAAFALTHIGQPFWRRAITLAFVVLVVGTSVPAVLGGGRPILSDDTMRELLSLRPLISNPSRTLISAPHGAEWWTAWLLHTRIAQAGALRPEDWTTFDYVLFLQVKSGMQEPGFGKMPPGETWPPGLNGGIGFPGALGSKGKIPRLMAAPIPPDAEVLHDGEHLKLARVHRPPPPALNKPDTLNENL
jgi:hypothetical protein